MNNREELKMQTELANYILIAMAGHGLRMRDLYEAVSIVSEACGKEATIRVSEGHVKPLDHENTDESIEDMRMNISVDAEELAKEILKRHPNAL